MKAIEQIISFLQENWKFIVPLIIIPITGIFLSPYLGSRLKEKQEKKNQHLKEIKEKVFQSLKEGIDKYYLPTLEEKRVNIAIKGKSKRSKFLTEEDYKKVDKRLEFMFTILEPKEASSLRRGTLEPLGKLPSFVPDTKFYSCVKKKHFPSFIQKWEKFKRRFDAYNEGCLQIAEKIKKEIRNQINLPSYNGSTNNSYMCEYDLALFVLKKCLQEDCSDVLKKEPNLTALYIRREKVAQGENQKVKECEEKIRELVQRENRTKGLAKQAAALIPDVKALKDEVEQLLSQKRLPGKCEYT